MLDERPVVLATPLKGNRLLLQWPDGTEEILENVPLGDWLGWYGVVLDAPRSPDPSSDGSEVG